MNTTAASQAVLDAQALYAAGDAMRAFALLSDALAHEPTQRDLLRFRAHLSIVCKNPLQAEMDLESLLAIYPDDAEAWDDRGVLYQLQKNYIEAAACHLKALDLDIQENFLLNLAIAMTHLDQKEQAVKLYQDILAINPANSRALVNLAVMHDERGDNKEAAECLKQAEALGETSFEFYMAFGNTCRHRGERDAAIDWYRKAVALYPNNSSAQFMLAMMEGRNPDAPPADHIAGLFDSYAANFEQSLLTTLKYRAPELLFDAMAPQLEALKKQYGDLSGIDLGAGTGLFGKRLRPYLKTSIGLDLSAQMLAKAQEQKIYDSVVCSDIVKGLEAYSDQSLHVVTAADVFVYIGRLDEIFKAAHDKLKPDGVLAFTTEAMTTGETGAYLLRDTGRYAHHETYLKQLADISGFDCLAFNRDWSRYNKDQPLDGFVVVLKKRPV